MAPDAVEHKTSNQLLSNLHVKVNLGMGQIYLNMRTEASWELEKTMYLDNEGSKL